MVLKEMTTDLSKQVKLGYVSGLVPRDKSIAFERILFRATRGNVFLKQDSIEEPVIDPVTGQKVIRISIYNFLNHVTKSPRFSFFSSQEISYR